MSDIYGSVENELGVLRIIYDEDSQDPREDNENLGTMVCWHSNYKLGDKHKFSDSDEFMFWLLEETLGSYEKAERKLCAICDSVGRYTRGYRREVDRKIIEFVSSKFLVLPMYLYDHSIQSVSMSSFIGRAHHAEWDSGQVGWVYVSKAKIREEYGCRLITKKVMDKVMSVLKAEMETYDKYIRGDVFGFVLEDKDGKEIDSCWGFYGSDFENNGIVDNLPEEYRPLVKLFH